MRWQPPAPRGTGARRQPRAGGLPCHWQSPLKPSHPASQPCSAALACPRGSALLTPTLGFSLQFICRPLAAGERVQPADPAGGQRHGAVVLVAAWRGWHRRDWSNRAGSLFRIDPFSCAGCGEPCSARAPGSVLARVPGRAGAEGTVPKRPLQMEPVPRQGESEDAWSQSLRIPGSPPGAGRRRDLIADCAFPRVHPGDTMLGEQPRLQGRASPQGPQLL